jgi:hypothetical protein
MIVKSAAMKIPAKPKAGALSGIRAAISDIFSRDLTVTDKGSTSLGTEYQVRAPVREILTELTGAITTALPSESARLGLALNPR